MFNLEDRFPIGSRVCEASTGRQGTIYGYDKSDYKMLADSPPDWLFIRWDDGKEGRFNPAMIA